MLARLPRPLALLALFVMIVGATVAWSILVTASLASAATGDVTSDVGTISLPTAAVFVSVAAFVIPALVELITKSTASSSVKVVVSLALNAVSAVIAVLIATDGGYDWYAFLLAFVLQFVTTGAAYARALKPAGLIAVFADLLPLFGFGEKPLTPEIEEEATTGLPPNAGGNAGGGSGEVD